MAVGKNCPNCGRDIGVWPIFSAGLPSRIFCPHCQARLRYRKTLTLLLAVPVMAALVAVGAFFATGAVAPAGWRGLALLGIFMVIFAAAWCVVEVLLTWLLRSRYELEIVKPASPAGE